jgi:hypothetical protein
MIHTVSARLAAALVATVAGAASYEHIASVAIGAGERDWVGYSLPLAIDGLILVGVAALLEDKRSDRVGRLSARVAIVVGVVATLAANLASAEPTWTARAVAVAAPVSFLLSVEVLTRVGKPRIPVHHGAEKSPTRGNALSATHSQDQGTPPTRVRAKPRSKPTGERVAAAVARTPSATPAELAARLRLSERTVHRYLPAPPAGPLSRQDRSGAGLPHTTDLEPSPNGGPS